MLGVERNKIHTAVLICAMESYLHHEIPEREEVIGWDQH